MAAGVLLFLLTGAQARQVPGVLLFDAALSDARAFTVEIAASRGWSVPSVTSTTAVFEQILEGEDVDGVMVVQRLLRIFADFAEESAGIRVSLRAEEIEHPATDAEWMTDVTGRYADNLTHALASLRAKWDAQRAGPAKPPSAQNAINMGRLAPLTGPMTSAPVGTWAYAAERYAQSRGCELTERPTQLEANGQGWEHHRVFCRKGSAIRVQCRNGDCTDQP